MQNFMIALLFCSVTMSVLALFYMAITPFLAKRYSEKGRYYAWLIIVIGLIIPFRPQFSNAIVKVDMLGEMAAPVIRISDMAPVTIPAPNAALPSALPSISWWEVAVAVWLTGVIVFLAYHIIKHCCFVKMVKRWSKNITDEQPFTLLQSLKSEMRISKEISLYRCSSIGSPMMIGFVTPRILLPKADLTHDELRFVFKHELVHYKRKDLYYKCLVLIATAMHWFNPIVYLMAKIIDVGCESSCDAETMLGVDSDTRRQYSETIIGVAKYQSKLKTALSTDFYGGKKGMKKRILSILDTKKKKIGIAILCGVLMLTLGTAMAFSANTGAIRTETDTGSFRAGDIVAVQIIADSVSNLNWYEFSLLYDDNALKPKSIHSAIDLMWAGGAPTDAGLTLSGVQRANADPTDDDYTRLSRDKRDGISGENMLVCEIVMEVMKDGQVGGLFLQDLFVSDTADNLVEDTSGWVVKVVHISKEQSLIWDGQETNLFDPWPDDGKPEMKYYEQSISLEPGELKGDYAGHLRLQVEKQDVSSGESFRVEVALSEPTEGNVADVYFWFDPDELTYQGFDGDEKLHPYVQVVDSDSGIVNLTFLSLEENGNQIDRFGSFSFMVSEDSQLSGGESSLIVVADYLIKDGDEKFSLSQTGEISVSIR